MQPDVKDARARHEAEWASPAAAFVASAAFIALSVAYVTFVFRPPYEACPCGIIFDMSVLEIEDIVLKVNNEWLYRSRKKTLEAKALDGEREVYLLLLQGTGDSRRPEPEPAELKKRMASEEMARLEQKHQTSHTTATSTTAFSGISPDHLKDLLLKHGIGGKRGALVGLYRQELRDEEENRVLEVKDVFYNTEHHRYSARYQYVDEMIAGETALEDMDWVHVYDLFEFATPIKTVDQSDAQLSEFEQHRLENIARNEKFLASLGFKDAGGKRH